MVSYRVIGQPVPKTEFQGKVMGSARYGADVDLPGLLWAKALRSPYPHARIRNIDTSRAEALPGVHAVLTGEDVKGIRYGRRYQDVPVLAQERALYAGDKVAAVAADDLETAQRALELIDVDYEVLPAVLDPEEATRDGAPILHPDVNSYAGLPELLETPSNAYVRDVIEKGNVEEGFANSDLVVENTFTVSRVHQAYLEPHCCTAWVDEEGRIQVWSPNKSPHSLKQTLSGRSAGRRTSSASTPWPSAAISAARARPWTSPCAASLPCAAAGPSRCPWTTWRS